jgi:cytosolic carboxypeptidase protein 2/3
MGRTYYTLTFTYEFEYENDAVYFAYSVPYTYTDLLDDIVAIEMDPARGSLISRKTLCKTLAGVNCDYLTVTSREKKENAT